MLIDAGDTGAVSRVRLVETGNTGETRSGEGGGDGNGIMTGCKGAMYRRLPVPNPGTAATVLFGLFPWQRDARCARKFASTCSLVSGTGDVIFRVNLAAHCT